MDIHQWISLIHQWYSLMDIHQWISMEIHVDPCCYATVSGGHKLFSFYWALVSEPGFLGFNISGFCMFDLFVWFVCLGNMVVRYRGINNKGVLDRPCTIWKVSRAISNTLKCQFTGKHENYSVRQNIADPGSIKMQNVFPLISVVPKPPQLPYGVKNSSCSWNQVF